jgi:hypothetical protein
VKRTANECLAGGNGSFAMRERLFFGFVQPRPVIVTAFSSPTIDRETVENRWKS